MRIGWELPNSAEIKPEEVERLKALPPQVVKARPYHFNVRNEDRSDAGWPVLIRREYPNCAIAIRPDSDGAITSHFDAIDIAFSRGFTTIYWIVDNEPNHDPSNEAGRPANRNHLEACAVVARRIRSKYASMAGITVKTVSPPFAVAQNDEAWNAALIEFMDAYDYVGCHVYGQGDDSLAHHSLMLASIHGKPIFVDEFGDSSKRGDEERAAYSAHLLNVMSLYPVDVALMFILGGTEDWKQFWLSPDALRRHIGLRIEGDARMPAETKITIAKAGPAYAPGFLEIEGHIEGFDGSGAVHAKLTFPLPPRDEDPAYLQIEAANAFGITDFVGPSGPFRLRIPIPPAVGMPDGSRGSVKVATVELNSASNEWDSKSSVDVPVLFFNNRGGFVPPPDPVAPTPVEPQPQSPTPPETQVPSPLPFLGPWADMAFVHAGNLANAMKAGGFGEGTPPFEAALDFHRWISFKKGEGGADPFSRPRKGRR